MEMVALCVRIERGSYSYVHRGNAKFSIITRRGLLLLSDNVVYRTEREKERERGENELGFNQELLLYSVVKIRGPK